MQNLYGIIFKHEQIFKQNEKSETFRVFYTVLVLWAKAWIGGLVRDYSDIVLSDMLQVMEHPESTESNRLSLWLRASTDSARRFFANFNISLLEAFILSEVTNSFVFILRRHDWSRHWNYQLFKNYPKFEMRVLWYGLIMLHLCMIWP